MFVANTGGRSSAFRLRINDRNQGNIQRAIAEYFAAQRELERTQFELRSEFAETFAVYKSAREEARTYREEIMPSLERVVIICSPPCATVANMV